VTCVAANLDLDLDVDLDMRNQAAGS
jgi:hypothetical protein